MNITDEDGNEIAIWSYQVRSALSIYLVVDVDVDVAIWEIQINNSERQKSLS